MSDSRMEVFEAESVILREGSSNDLMYKIVKGSVAVYLNYGEENEYLVCMLSEGKCFGEIGLFSKRKEIYTVVAFTKVLVLKIRRDDVSDFVTENHSDIMNILESMANTIYAMKANIDMLAEELSHSESITPTTITDITRRIYKINPSMLPGAAQIDRKL